MLADLHIHPSFSIDAQGELEDYIKVAIEKGLSQICFTTHLDLEPSRKAIDRFIRLNGKIVYADKENIREYVRRVKGISLKYRGKIDVRVGLEIGWSVDARKEIEDFLRDVEIDLRIGSVHIIDGIAITSSKEAVPFLRKHGIEHIAGLYYENLVEAARSGLFDVLGHIDGYKKYTRLAFPSGPYEYRDEKLIAKLLSECLKHNLIFELNTSATLKGHNEFYPSRWILELAIESGIKKISLGSDSHSPRFVGN
ncbi:MAG: histidinol-phosphatase HisJ family protein, partial [bacterium]